MFQNPDFQQLLQMLREIKTIAVVGLSPKASRPSYRVALGMQQRGYRIIPVRPALDEVLGEKAYPNLAALPARRASRRRLSRVRTCRRHRRRMHSARRQALWLQDGVINEPAANRAAAAGMTVIMDRCILRDCSLSAIDSRRSASVASR